MPATDFGALTSAQKRVWAGEIWQQFRDDSFWMSNGFIGNSQSDMNRPIYRVTDLTETERGRECVMQLVNDLQGDGVADDNKLEGKEEALVNDTQIIKLSQLRHGVKSKGAMAEQATVVRFRTESKNKLAFWLPDKIDELMFLTAAGRSYTLNTDGSSRGVSELSQLKFAADVTAPSTNRTAYAGSATSEATLTAADKMTWNGLVGLQAQAKRRKIRPIRQGGKDYYVVVMTPEQKRDVQTDPNYQANVGRGAERGSDNPLFKNAIVTVAGLVLYDHNKVFNTTGLTSGSKWGAAGTVEGAQAMMLGAQALGFATIGSASWAESDNTDYGNRPGVAYGQKFGILKPQFKPTASAAAREDYGVLTYKTASALTV